jgi:GNAT superfamily N-acetyltransferase
VRIRDAESADCSALSALAFASKAWWGYDDAFMEACRVELTVAPADLCNTRVRIADEDDVERPDQLLGFHGLRGDELWWMFVAPDAMSRGVGRALFDDACMVARDAGVRTLRIEADPNATAFYERMGAHRVGEVPSASIEGRVLPLYSLDLALIS